VKYLNKRQVKQKFHDHGRQITKCGLHAIDTKVDSLVERLCTHFNGHHKRVDGKIVELFKT
jgi:hypothetical protein